MRGPRGEMWNILFCVIIPSLLILRSCHAQQVPTAQSDDCGILEELPNDARTQAPWVAAIFARPNSKHKFDFRISGTVLGPTTILTIFAGAFGEPITKGGKYFLSPPSNYKVAVGIKTNSLADLDVHSQVAEVNYMVPFTGHESDNREYHYFIFHLKTPLHLKTPYVRAACIPVLVKFFGSDILEKIHELRQGGFTVPALSNGANPLQILKVNLASNGYCSHIYKRFYKGSSGGTYCGNITNASTNLSCTLHGSAPVIPLFNNRWFLLGITALIPPLKSGSDWCNRNSVYFYGKLNTALDWIENNIKCGPTNFTCGDGECITLDHLCDKKSDCSGSEDEDAIFCRARKPCIYDGKSHECGIYGECIRPEQVCDGTRNCYDNSDEDLSICGRRGTSKPGKIADRIETSMAAHPAGLKCQRLQISEGVEIACRNSVSSEGLSCDDAVPGTIAKFRCKNYYKSVYRLPMTESKCTEDGTWKPVRPFGCEPDCGIISSSSQMTRLIPFILEGQVTTNVDIFPWHAAIFFRKQDEFTFICGGSLIEKSFIVTAAHCVTDSFGVIRGKQSFKISLGSVGSTFMKNQNNSDVQNFNAANIWVPSTYDRRNLQSDIALIELDKPATFGEFIRPICYFSQGGQGVPNVGDIGKVAGLGFVDNKNVAKHLMFASFPVVSTSECTKALKMIPPLSTFCAGYQNGTAVCQGDSGGGMAFPEHLGQGVSSTRYILKGIVSHGEVLPGKLCNPNNFAVFTHVDAYADWILQRLEETLNK